MFYKNKSKKLYEINCEHLSWVKVAPTRIVQNLKRNFHTISMIFLEQKRFYKFKKLLFSKHTLNIVFQMYIYSYGFNSNFKKFT